MSLARLQQQFAQQLLAPQDDAVTLAVSGPAPAAQLLQLYRNNFYLGLGEYLEGCYPASRKLVGEEFFAQLAKAYVRDQPLSEPALEDYGAALADFVAGCPQAEFLPWLADFVRLEWQLECAKMVGPRPPFPFAALAELSSAQQQRLGFRLADGVVLVDSPYPLYALWRGVQRGDLSQIDLSRGECVAICPTGADGAELLNLPPEQYQLLDQLRRGTALAELTLPDNVQSLIGAWIQQGLIGDFHLPPSEDTP